MAKPLISAEELQQLGYGAELCQRWDGIISRAQRDRRILIDLHEVFIELCGEVGSGFGGPSTIARILERCDWELVRTMTGRQPKNQEWSPVPEVSQIHMSDALYDLFCTGVFHEMQKIRAEVPDNTHLLLALMHSDDADFLDFLRKARVNPRGIIRRTYKIILENSCYCDIAPPRQMECKIPPERMVKPNASTLAAVAAELESAGLGNLAIKRVVVHFD